MYVMVKGMFANTGLTGHIHIWTSFKDQEMQSSLHSKHACTYLLRVRWCMGSGETGLRVLIYYFDNMAWDICIRLRNFQKKKVRNQCTFVWVIKNNSKSFVLFNLRSTCSQAPDSSGCPSQNWAPYTGEEIIPGSHWLLGTAGQVKGREASCQQGRRKSKELSDCSGKIANLLSLRGKDKHRNNGRRVEQLEIIYILSPSESVLGQKFSTSLSVIVSSISNVSHWRTTHCILST